MTSAFQSVQNAGPPPPLLARELLPTGSAPTSLLQVVRELRMPPPVPASFVPIQILSSDGELTELGKEVEIHLDQLCGFYRDMVLARSLDSEALALQRQGGLGLWLMSLGQEAAQVGSVRALNPEDWVFPSYREHAAALCRGITPHELLVQWRGNAHSGWDPQARRFHIYSLVLGSQTLHATGYAMGIQRDRAAEVVLTYFGDGAASQGDVNEALNWAAVVKAPVVFFCQNNQWAISTPSSVQSATPLHQRAAGFGLTSYLVDGNDVLAVHAVTRAAVEQVRAGEGPAFIEAITYRSGGHSTSDDPSRYRTVDQESAWVGRDPLSRVERYLRSVGTPAAFFDDVTAKSNALALDVRAACLALTPPNLTSAFEYVYAEPHPQLAEEERQFRAYAAGFVGASAEDPSA